MKVCHGGNKLALVAYFIQIIKFIGVDEEMSQSLSDLIVASILCRYAEPS
jgi:hypothetical protein